LTNEQLATVAPVEETSTHSNQDASHPVATQKAMMSFEELYKDVVIGCLRADNTTWMENAFLIDGYSTPRESADALRHLVARHLLKECGDARGAAAILEALHDGLGIEEDSGQKFYRLLCRYTAQELDAIDASPIDDGARATWPGSESYAISLVVWGDEYIERFDQYCAKSLAAEDNVPALKSRGPVTLLVHTAAQDVEKIRKLPSLARLDVKLQVSAIPNDLLDVAKGDLKYWLLGALQSIHLFHAARQGDNFLPIFPDAFYSARYFRSIVDLSRNGEDAIFLSGFKASRREVVPQLAPYLKRDAYAVPGARLVELAMRHADPYLLNCFIDPSSDALPRNRVLFAHCGDHLEVRAPHYNPVFMRNSIIKDIPSRYLMTLDSEIDKVLPSTCLTHFRTSRDDYFATELVDDEIAPPGKIAVEDYADFFVEHANAAHLPFEKATYQIAIQPDWLTVPPKVSLEDAQRCFDKIYDRVGERIEKIDHLARPHIVWIVLQTFAESATNEGERRLLDDTRRIARAKLVALGETLYAEGRLSDLDSLLAPVLRVDAPPAEAFLFAGHCRHHLGFRKEALDFYRKAEDIDPTLPDLRVCLAAFHEDDTFTEEQRDALLPGFSLPRPQKLEARRFLDRHAAPHLSTLYTNDNMIVFQRALTFLNDPKFMRGLVKSSEVSPGTVDDRTWRVHILIWAARSALKLEGDFVELGTFRAFFAGCIVDYLDFGSLDRKLYLYDTFQGLPDDAVHEEHLPDSFYASLTEHYSAPDIYDSVQARFAHAPNVTAVQGKLPDTLREICPERIAWLHVDLNSATHEIASLEYLWDRICVGGFIILDDYGFAIFSTQTRAHQEFFASKGLTIAELPTGQGLVIKTHAN
jgi:tetratricopeptide (TPR) repeat protein